MNRQMGNDEGNAMELHTYIYIYMMGAISPHSNSTLISNNHACQGISTSRHPLGDICPTNE